VNKYFPFELHCHTYCSDGSMSPAQLIDNAKSRGLAGIGITDHNTYSAISELQAIAQKDDFVLLKGIEWTTFWGHFTAFGAESIDWRELNCGNINQMLARAKESGALVSIAHPFRLGAPVCSGCRMEYPITDYHNIDGYEIMSGPFPYKQIFNANAIAEYDRLLAQGYKIAALYGYDWHTPDKGFCYGATYLPAKAAQEALNAIRAQNTFVSLGLHLCVRIDNRQVAFGSAIDSGEHYIEVQVNKDILPLCKKFEIEPKEIIVRNNQHIYRTSIKENAIRVVLQTGYFRIEVRGSINGDMDALLASTSPIYIKGD